MVDERRREPRVPVEYLATLVTGKDARATASLPNCPTGACGSMRSDTDPRRIWAAHERERNTKAL